MDTSKFSLTKVEKIIRPFIGEMSFVKLRDALCEKRIDHPNHEYHNRRIIYAWEYVIAPLGISAEDFVIPFNVWFSVRENTFSEDRLLLVKDRSCKFCKWFFQRSIFSGNPDLSQVSSEIVRYTEPSLKRFGFSGSSFEQDFSVIIARDIQSWIDTCIERREKRNRNAKVLRDNVHTYLCSCLLK
jgi:hypothetical protein